LAGAAATAVLAVAPAAQAGTPGSFIGRFHKLTTIGSTVPANGDVNPYGTALVTRSQGSLVKGNVLISNFNNAKNLQGTGTTIVQVSPSGKLSVFAKIRASKLPGPCPGGVGLTTALEILRGGWVVVGSLPTKDGSSATSAAGCLIVLDNRGHVRETFSGNGINGPWDMAAASHGPSAQLFVSNVLNGTKAAGGKVVRRGTILRLDLMVGGSKPPRLINTTKIGSGFPQRTDPGRPGDRPDRSRPRPRRHAVRSQQPGQRHQRDSGCDLAFQQRGDRHKDHVGRGAQHPAGPDHRAER
jgi:hypothetical protein